ncbi:putative spore germination protein GerPD [Paenibacillus macerans]|nr:spore gernimation protein GerPD [Paenibacillus macerans]GBK61754.1 spore gernimation protein GerPD [Paenibacillus macerans]GBK68061.1 spore gernimation protein GerPD [Paenibacillus macerans]GJM67987.1 putative spore germination protein GerPD [Paenibacillus macerans]
MNEKIRLDVTNDKILVDNMKIVAVGSSSVVLIGDTGSIRLSSIFDTPPESLIIGPLVPFAR